MNPHNIVAMLECIHHEDFRYRGLFIEDGKSENIIARIFFLMEIIKRGIQDGIIALYVCVISSLEKEDMIKARLEASLLIECGSNEVFLLESR